MFSPLAKLGLERLDDRIVPSLLTTLADTDATGTQGSGTAPEVSGNGRFVAFETTSRLVAADHNGFADVYMKDRVTGAITLISADVSGNAVGGTRPSVSGDGRYVVFQSQADSIAGGAQYTFDIFRRDTATGTTALVSVGEATDCANASVNDDGNRVAFERSYPSPLWGYRFYPHVVGASIVREVAVRDVAAGTTTVVSPPHQDDNPGYQGPFSIPYVDAGYRDSHDAKISGDGNVVVFLSRSRGVGTTAEKTTDIHHVYLPTLALSRLPIGNLYEASSTLGINRDGRVVAFDSRSEAFAGGNASNWDVFAWEPVIGSVTVVSSSAAGVAGNGESHAPAVSGDGRYVAFSSISNDLVPGDTGGVDVFVKDRVTGAVTRASSTIGGGTADGNSWHSSISRDGRVVAFQSQATDLVANDANGDTDDVFVREWPRPGLYAAAPDAGGQPRVDLRSGEGRLFATVDVYDGTFTGGTTVAVADVTGDGTADLVTGPGAGGGPNVRVFNGVGYPLVASFYAYSMDFTGGVNVAAGDVDGDGYADIVCGPGAGGGPNVRIFDGRELASGNVALIASFFAYADTFTGGVRVAVGDVNGDGYFDLICGAGAGGSANVRVFDGRQLALGNASLGDVASGGALVASFVGMAADFTGGVFVAAGDLDNDGRAEVVVGAGAGGPNVRAFDPRTEQLLFSLYADSTYYSGGVRVTCTDSNQDGYDDIIAGSGVGAPSQARVIDGKTRTVSNDWVSLFFVYKYAWGSPDGGVNVG